MHCTSVRNNRNEADAERDTDEKTEARQKGGPDSGHDARRRRGDDDVDLDSKSRHKSFIRCCGNDDDNGATGSTTSSIVDGRGVPGAVAGDAPSASATTGGVSNGG